ncbi:hypothetical protein PFISCL1PPCAC_21329, partial [Pristionchus fissidentatus]
GRLRDEIVHALGNFILENCEVPWNPAPADYRRCIDKFLKPFSGNFVCLKYYGAFDAWLPKYIRNLRSQPSPPTKSKPPTKKRKQDSHIQNLLNSAKVYRSDIIE